MFGFFKRKNKDNGASKEQTVRTEVSLQGSIEDQYKSLLNNHRSNLSEASTVAQNYIKKDNYTDKNEWLDALAICDIALQENKVDNTIK